MSRSFWFCLRFCSVGGSESDCNRLGPNASPYTYSTDANYYLRQHRGSKQANSATINGGVGPLTESVSHDSDMHVLSTPPASIDDHLNDLDDDEDNDNLHGTAHAAVFLWIQLTFDSMLL